MKKQLLIAAVAASMTSVAMADVSITGAAKFNLKDANTSYSTDIMISGAAGETSVDYKLKLTKGGFETETATVSTSVGGVNVKAGAWKSGANELDQESAAAVNRINVSTSMGGVKLTAETDNGDSGTDISISGSVSGVALSHKMNSNDSSETTVSTSMGGVSLAYNVEEAENGDESTATTVSTSMSGFDIKYVAIDSDLGTDTDGYVTKKKGVKDASAIGISTSVGGNTVTFKSIDVDATGSNQFIITRPLNGATFEATYTDFDDATTDDSLDLELAVKF